MKRQLTIIILSFSILILQPPAGFAQSKKEMQEQMLSAMNELNNQIADLKKQIAEAKKNKEDVRSIKLMEDQLALLKKQLAIMGGANKGISNMPAKAIEQTSEEENNSVPERDDARIKSMPDKILSDAELIPYLKNITAAVEKKISAEEKMKAEKLRTGIKTKENYTKALANVANACWMNGYPEIALYLMGKACTSDLSNGNNLNNYAAFLIMAGGEHAALPILQNLNKKYPNNSTILNNMGQAWYGLGEMNNANRYLDNAMHLYPMHSQANLTKAEIQESEGNTQGSIESIKRSIRENYTTEKEARLNQLGGKLKYEDITWKYPGPAAPLGFEKFLLVIPEYPLEGGYKAETLKYEWYYFREMVREAKQKIDDEILQLKIKADAYKNKLVTKNGNNFDPHPELLRPYNTKAYKTSNRKLALLNEWGTDRILDLNKKMMAAGDSVGKWKEEFNQAFQNAKDDCAARLAAATNFLLKANTLWHVRNNEWLTFQKEYSSSKARLYLYAFTDRSVYELAIATMKSGFLSYIAGLPCEFEVGCVTREADDRISGKKLPDFDEMNCNYRDEIFIPPFTTIIIECNKMTTEFYISPEFNYGPEVSPYLKVGWEENLNTDKITKSTVEIGAEMGLGGAEFGPLKAELKAEGGVGIEFTEHGIEEVYIKGGARVDVGPEAEHSVSNYTTATGMETEVSWNAGNGSIKSGASGKGLLNTIHIGGH